MFNLLVNAGGWADNHDTFSHGRILEYTTPALVTQMRADGVLNVAALTAMPTLFMDEMRGDGEEFARVGTIMSIRDGARGQVLLDYIYDANVPPIPIAEIYRLRSRLGINDYEFSRTHWAVKDIDLFRFMLTELRGSRRHPRIFQLPESATLVDDQLSVMMPFANSALVLAAIQRAAGAAGMRCDRADDIWDHQTVMEDVVALIDRSAIVVCDCTGRNANVFYEIGLAHAWGKEVILITQNPADIPFDLAHLRYLHYHPNNEGLATLEAQLLARIRTLRGG
ncbi:hypothetical protein [Pseudomonas izuensis]|uniref:hypothetical protein n=1 Tax=Pseudomonas izuensis TaxID=2684212 RepID=UPI001FEC5E8B|nr:hypothetical protein [Pseudomonas izuensis]